MKKSIIRILLAVATFAVILSLTVGAADVFRFSPEVDPTANGGPNGGYWAKDAATTVEASANNGVVLNNTGDTRVIWAFYNDQIEQTPYLCFDLPEGTGVYKITLSKNWDIELEVELDIKQGTNIFNVKELLSSQTTIGYTYFAFYFTGGVPGTVDNLYLSSVDPSVEAPETGDALAIAIVAAAACGVAVFTKKH